MLLRAIIEAPGAPLSDATDAANRQHAQMMADAHLASGKDEFVFEDVAYRPGTVVDIIEESQPIEVAKKLAKLGKRVTIRDRAGIISLVRRTYGNLFEYDVTPTPATETLGHAENGHPAKRARTDESNTSMGNPLSSYTR